MADKGRDEIAEAVLQAECGIMVMTMRAAGHPLENDGRKESPASDSAALAKWAEAYDAVVAAALAWRDADERMRLHEELIPAIDRLRAACDKYREAQRGEV